MIASPHDLTYFIELTSTLNFSRAAERIGISQPSLSTAIKRLEEAVGTSLFIRKKSGITLTQAGKRLLSHAKQLLQLWDTVKSASLASHYEVQGSVSLGCHPSVGIYTLPKFLPALLKKYPKLEVKLQHDISRKITEGVINLSIDVGIVVNPVKHPDLIIQKLYDDKTLFWQAKTLKNKQQQWKDGQIVILCDPVLAQPQWLLKQLHKKGIKHYRMISSSNLEVIAELTAQGAGIGILPTSIAYATGTLNLQPLTDMPSYNDEISLIYRHENREIMAVQTMVQAIKHAISFLT
jgi:DNA-binding transcriptional LysR family regulator